MHRNSRITIVRARSPRNNLYQIILSQNMRPSSPSEFLQGRRDKENCQDSAQGELQFAERNDYKSLPSPLSLVYSLF